PRIELSSAQQEQPSDRKCDTQESLPRRRFVKKHDPGNGHDRRTASQNRRHGGERATLLEQQKECDRSRTNADAGQHRVENSFSSRFLVPSAHKPKKSEIKQDRQRGRCFNDKSTKAFTDVI